MKLWPSIKQKSIGLHVVILDNYTKLCFYKSKLKYLDLSEGLTLGPSQPAQAKAHFTFSLNP